jgi:hypothetical protein
MAWVSEEVIGDASYQELAHNQKIQLVMVERVSGRMNKIVLS